MPSRDFTDRVRQRAYIIWEQEGRPAGRSEQHWRAAELIESADELPLDTQTAIEILQFESDLAEVQLLLDFISGRSDIGFADNIAFGSNGAAVGTAAAKAAGLATGGTASVASHAITEDKLQQISLIRYPPEPGLVAKANNAAFLLIFRDELNRRVWPANGLTIAFTLLIWTSISSISRLFGHPKSGRKHQRRHWARWTLATNAYPRLWRSVLIFKLGFWSLITLAVGVVWLSLWTSQAVADGQAKLARVAALEQEYVNLVSALEQIENVTPVSVPGSSPIETDAYIDGTSFAVSVPSIPDLYCPAAKSTAAGIAVVPASASKVSNPQQYETCYQIRTVEAQLILSQSELRYWWKRWNNSILHLAAGSLAPNYDAKMPAISNNKVLVQQVLSSSSVLTAELAEVSGIWLPMLYGLIGAIFATLRRIYQKISNSTLAPWDMQLMWGRVLLGAMAGAFIGLFFAPSGTSVEGVPGIGTLSLSAIAFLAGYAVDGLFLLLDDIISRMFRLGSDVSSAKR